MIFTVSLIVIAVAVTYYYGTNSFKYWKLKGVKHDQPIPFLGNNARNYFMRRSTTQLRVEAYWRYPAEKVVGFYRASRPELIIRDPEIAKRILTTDFLYFYARGFFPSKYPVEPLMRNLFFADGDLWRLLRQRMTPAFSSGKLRAMFPLIAERAERLQARALLAAAAGRELDARDLMARYTTDFIGACGFGLDADSLQDEDSAFRQLGAKIFQIGPKEIFVAILKELYPGTFKNLKLVSRVEKGIYRLVGETLKQRKYEPSPRNDFIDLLLECKKRGTIVEESIERFKPNGQPETVTLDMDDELIAAQVLVFFAAGFETSSSATSMTLHELAHHPAVQEKVQQEIDRVLTKHDNKLSYEAIKEMTYLEWTLKEGMRIFPSLGYLQRECRRKYVIKELNLSIDEGVKVFIPLQAMHNDPQYFEDPTVFRPERFAPENFDTKRRNVYMPFGIGPRACVGERLGLMQSLAGLAAVLARFSVRPARSTIRHPAVEPANNVVQSVRGGLPLLFVRRTG